MRIFKFLLQLVFMFVATLAGNWIGTQIRAEKTGQISSGLWTEFETPSGKKYRNFPAVTKFYPALLLAVIGEPRWFWALIGGTLTGWLLDDKYEKALLGRLMARLEE